jgi:hypothetical protein
MNTVTSANKVVVFMNTATSAKKGVVFLNKVLPFWDTRDRE